ncbi:MAG TPA: sodium:solute symporter family protein [Thermoanaerobaculia bacterium]|nr:sodium:solute symporter family protein [Thermoanaerobaculia bacterium]
MTSVLVILAYLVGVTVVASLYVRKSRDSESWTVASGQMGLIMVAAGVAGTRIGGVGTYGVAGDVMTSGLWNLWYAVNTFLALALVGLFFARPYRRLKLHTVSEIFPRRFGARRCQVLTSLCVQTEYLIVNILEPYVIGSILAALLDIPFGVAVLIGAAILIVATSLGGLWGNTVANIIHCATILGGLSIVGWLGLQRIGGWVELQVAVDGALAGGGLEPGRWWSFVGAGWGAVIAMFFSATIHTPAASVYVNFASSARSERSILPAFLLGGLIAAAMPLLAGWIGMQTLAVYGPSSGLRSYSAITQLAVDISPLIGGVALAAVLAAVISSGGPILLASATLFLKDWVPAYDRMPGHAKLRALRMTTVAIGLIAALLAWQGQISSILDLLLLGFAMVVPPAVAIGYLLYWTRTTERACFWSMVVGYAGGLVWYLGFWWIETLVERGAAAPALLEWAARGVEQGRWWIDPSYVTTLIPLVLVPVISLSGGSEPEEAARFRRAAGTL